jgi:DNA repair exonuclease SbcCD ATPase subunit
LRNIFFKNILSLLYIIMANWNYGNFGNNNNYPPGGFGGPLNSPGGFGAKKSTPLDSVKYRQGYTPTPLGFGAPSNPPGWGFGAPSPAFGSSEYISARQRQQERQRQAESAAKLESQQRENEKLRRENENLERVNEKLQREKEKLQRESRQAKESAKNAKKESEDNREYQRANMRREPDRARAAFNANAPKRRAAYAEERKDPGHGNRERARAEERKHPGDSNRERARAEEEKQRAQAAEKEKQRAKAEREEARQHARAAEEARRHANEEKEKRRREGPPIPNFIEPATDPGGNCPCYNQIPKLESTTCDTLKKDYRKQTMIFHPDRNAGCNELATEKFKYLNDLNEFKKGVLKCVAGGKRKTMKKRKSMKKRKI